ncbi:acyl transferase/acyl hydrolase/lysophospholipase [Phyllosticta citrichinensis]
MTRLLSLHKRSDVSDSDERSPWARKTILSLDGGGIKGYSQLLIKKRLMYRIEQIERGLVPGQDVSDPDPKRPQYYAPNNSSEDYRWNPTPLAPLSQRQARALEPAETLADSVNKTFSGDYEATAFKPHHYFDYCVGTSTGGLSAIMLSRMELDVETALKQYDVVGNQVFGHPRLVPKYVSASSLVQPKYASARMEKALQDITKAALLDEMQQWGTSEKTIPFQSDAERSRTVVVARGKNLARKTGVTWRPYLFRTFDHLPPAPFASPARNNQHLNPGHAHRMPIWQVARATSAAPTYFEPLKAEGFMFKDGGLGTNNPASVALQEVTQLHEQKPLLLLSIGTGRAMGNDDDEENSEEDENAAMPGGPKIPSILEPFFENLAAFKFMRHLVTETEQVHEHMLNRFEDEAAAHASSCSSSAHHAHHPQPHPTTYHRLNVSTGIGRVIPLDSWRPSSSGTATKAAMLAATTAYLSRAPVDAAIHQTAQLLVRLRRRRAATERWERFAARYAYYCPEPACPAQGRGFESRGELRAHAHERHGFWVRGSGGVRGAAVCVAGRGWACGEEGCWDDNDEDDDESGGGGGGGPRTFTDEAAYREHLARDHRIVDWSRFASRRAAEAWLDGGRIERKRAWRNTLQRDGGGVGTLEGEGEHATAQGLEKEKGEGGGEAASTRTVDTDVERLKKDGGDDDDDDDDDDDGDADADGDVVIKKLQLRVWRALLESRRQRQRQQEQSSDHGSSSSYSGGGGGGG